MKYFIQKYKILFILLSCGLVLLFPAANDPAMGFVVFAIPGILLGLLVFLTTNSGIRIPNFTSNKKESTADDLLKWLELKEKGVITEEEFQKKRIQILEE